ncbi:MAG: HEAT repeat domain-containing protein [Gemmatimonadaceae bacterium]
MNKAALITAALGIFALATVAVAQDPTPQPTPAPPTRAVKPTPGVKPTPAPAPTPKAKRRPVITFEAPSMDFEMPNMDFEMPDVDFELAPHTMAWTVGPDMPLVDFDMEMPEFPAMPTMPPEPMLMDPVAMQPVPPMQMAPMSPMTPMTPFPPMAIERIQGISPFERQFSGITSDPPKAWNDADPADSLYRLAREALNRGEYRRAAQLFGDISQKFPNSVYASDARYWRAFALYRIGGVNDLRDALNALQDSGRSYRQASLQTDAPVLATRIRGALAAKGDADARKMVNVAAAQPGGACDREDLAVRVEALNSLGQTDPESTTPILRRLLARRDECSAGLRRAALYLLGRRTDAEAQSLVIGAARNDPDVRVRAEALRFLAAMPGDQAISTIEEMARTPDNDELQRAAVGALGRSDSPRARQSLRNIIERSDVNEKLRIAALSSIDAEHAGDNGAYIRSLYPRLETKSLRAAAIRSVARIGGPDNDQWLLSIVRNQSEPADVRATALRYAGRSTIPIGDLTKMYDVAGDRPLREQLISLYSRRTEPEATDKLLDIARAGTDPDMRRYAISALSRKNDPRTKKLLLEIIDK